MQLRHDVIDFTKASEVKISDAFFDRMLTGNAKLDAIFATGLVRGSITTIKAKPGAGKSTFTLTIAEKLLHRGYRVGFASGEEASEQVSYTCQRLGVTDVPISTETDVDVLAGKMKDFDVLVIDSFQCLTTTHKLTKTKTVEYIINTIINEAKRKKCAIIFIVQLNADGTVKGGTTIPYAVDVNIDLYKEKNSDKRIFSVEKNRFGQTKDHAAMMTPTGFVFLGEVGQETPYLPEAPPNIKIPQKDYMDIIWNVVWTWTKSYIKRKLNEKSRTRGKGAR